MRILLVGAFGSLGGVQTHLRYLGRALVEAGADVKILAIDKQTPATLITATPGSAPVPPAPTPARPSAVRKTLDAVRLVRGFAPDVVVATGTGWNLILPVCIGAPAARKVYFEVMSGESAGWRDSRWGIRATFDEAIAQATPVARNLERVFRWGRPVPVIPAFPEPLETLPGLAEASHKRVALGSARAAMFGRLVPHKRALWLVKQWPLLEPVLGELHIHGAGPEEIEIRAEIARRGVGDRVRCHGPYPSGEGYVRLLQSYDLTLLPTVGAEGAPLVLLESMACGVPFVTRDVGGIADYAEGNPDCEFVPVVPGAFTAGVHRLAQRLDRGDVVQPRLQAYYRARFSYVLVKSRWIDFLLAPGAHIHRLAA